MSLCSLRFLLFSCFLTLFFSYPEKAGASLRKKKKEATEALSAEEEFVIKNFPLRTPLEWKIGEEFLYVGNRIDLTFRSDLFHGTPIENGAYKNTRFRFIGIETQNRFGMDASAVLCFERNGDRFYFDTQKTKSDLAKSPYYPFIPDLISLTEISRADSLLHGKRLYVKTARWYDEKGERVQGRKLIPVVIERIEAGEFVLPAKIWFRAEDDTINYSVSVRLISRMNSGESLTFDRIFGFTDPKLRYPDIPMNYWTNITLERVESGMDKLSCQLSWGMPQEIIRMPSSMGMVEQWLYTGGRFLLFEDGILTRLRD